MSDQDNAATSPLSGVTISQSLEAPTPISAVDLVRNALVGSVDFHNLGVEVVVAFNILQLVANPLDVKLYITRAVKFITLEFEVADSDKGKVIGRDGHTIMALRSFAKSLYGGGGIEYQIKLIEDRNTASNDYYNNYNDRAPRYRDQRRTPR